MEIPLKTAGEHAWYDAQVFNITFSRDRIVLNKVEAILYALIVKTMTFVTGFAKTRHNVTGTEIH